MASIFKFDDRTVRVIKLSDSSPLFDELLIVLHFPLKNGSGIHSTVPILGLGTLNFTRNDKMGAVTIAFTLFLCEKVVSVIEGHEFLQYIFLIHYYLLEMRALPA